MSTAALVVAAGEGRRFGGPKQFAYLKGQPVLEWTLANFETHPDIHRGGERRQDSVWQGFRLLDAARTKLVLVHDGARPLAGADLISRVLAAASGKGAAVPVVPVEDTLKETADGRIMGTPDRPRRVRAQTPQGFRYDVLLRALEAARADRFYGTDEAQLVERLGDEVAAVEGDPRNLKITTPLDLVIAEALLDV